MSFGKIYTYKGSPRAIGILVIAKSIGLDIEEAELQPANGVPDFYWKLNPLGKTPTFVGSDGWVLTECIAIALYVLTIVAGQLDGDHFSAVTKQDQNTTLMGSTTLDFVNIVRWMSLTNTDVVMRIARWVRPLIGYTLYSKEEVDKAQRETAQAIQIFEDHLRDREYLVSDCLTLADIMCTSLLTFAFAKVFDEAWREDFPNFTRWYVMVTNQPIFRAVLPEAPFVKVGLRNASPSEPFKAP